MKTASYENIEYIEDRVGPFNMKMRLFVYLVDGLLIDTGASNFEKRYSSFFRSHKIDKVAITHLHEDHAGLAGWIQQNIGADIYIHSSAVEKAKQDSEFPFYRKYYWGNMKGFNASPFSDCLKTESHCFQVIYTPGHTDNHVVLLEEEKKWLFCGDMYVAPRQKIAFFEENMAETIISLEKIAKLNFKHLFCAHSGIHHKGKEHILAKLDYFYKLREKIESLRKSGMNNDEINRIVFPKKRLITFLSGGECSSKHIVSTI